jgi:hypothetical protein
MKKLHIVTGTVLALAISAHGYGQGSQLPKYTVATLPSAASYKSFTVQVIDGISDTDCTVGGATGTSAHNALCSAQWNGSAYVWVPVASSAVSGVQEVDTDTTSGISGGPITDTGTIHCEQSSSSQFGCAKPDGTSITSTGGVYSAVFDGALKTDIVPPVGGQYVILYPTSGPNSGSIDFPPNCSFGDSGSLGFTFTGALAAQAPWVLPANVTAVYATATTSNPPGPGGGGSCFTPLQSVCSTASASASGTGSTSPTITPVGSQCWGGAQVTQQMVGLTGANIDSVAITGNSAKSGDALSSTSFGMSGVALIVYYTGSAPPADTAIKVQLPLTWDSENNILGIDPLAEFPGSSLQAWGGVAELPPAGSNTNAIFAVTDGASSSDCTTGGGSTYVQCKSNGTAWVAYSGGGTGITALTGDVTATGPGSAAATLATVNSGPGSCGDSTHVCQVTTNGKGLVTSQSAVAITGGGSGITSINSQTGPGITIHSSDSSVNVNTTTNDIDLTTAGGASGVQYNPATTAYIVSSWSGPYDDNDSNSASLGVPSSVSCVHTTTSTCTVAFGSAHGLAVGGAIDMFNLASWPYSQQAAQYGSFQVTTVPDSTHITFTTPTTLTYTCGPCTGNAYDASLWGIWQFAKQPYIYGHGTVYGLEQTSANLDTNFTTLTSVISGSPTYLIDVTGANDFSSGSSVATVESLHQSIWAKAHTAGMTVVQLTMPPAQYGVSGVGTKPPQLNYFYWSQALGKTATTIASGQYIDRYVDVATALLKADAIGSMPTPSVNQAFAKILNNAFGVQNGMPIQPPSTFTFSPIGGSGDVVSHGYVGPEYFYDANWQDWMHWDTAHRTMQLFAFSTDPLITQLYAGQSTGTTWYSDCLGQAASANNCFYRNFHYVSAGSTSNYSGISPYGGSDVMRFFANGGVQTPALVAASGTQPLMVDTAGNFSVGTAGSGDVTGPASSTADDIATYNGITGKIIKDSGIASANVVTAVTPTSPIAASITGHTLSVSCPTCGTSAGGTSVSQNSGSAETNLPITGFMPQVCSDTSGSGTAQSCTVANTFTPQAGNCVVYQTTTTNSGTGLTINVNSLGAKSVAIPGTSGFTTTLTALVIPANKPQLMCYDGTNWNDQQTGKSASSSSSIPGRTDLVFGSSPVTLPGSLSAYQSQAITIPTNGMFTVVAGINRATTGQNLHIVISAGTANCMYDYASQTDGNQVLYSTTSGGVQTSVNASGPNASRDFVGQGGYRLIVQNASTVTGAGFIWGMDGYFNSSTNATSNACPTAASGTIYVFVNAAALSDIAYAYVVTSETY